METTHATIETTNSRSLDPLRNIKDPVVETKGPIVQKLRSRLVVPQSVRQPFDHLRTQTWPALQTLAMRARLRLPRLSQVAVTRSEEQLEVELELPGVEPGDVEVSIHGSIVTIRATRNRQREHRTKDRYRLDRYREVFERSVPLDLSVDADKASATLKCGLLQVRLPKGKGANGKGDVRVAVRAA